MLFEIEAGQCCRIEGQVNVCAVDFSVDNTSNRHWCFSIQMLFLCEMEFILSLWCEVMVLLTHLILINP